MTADEIAAAIEAEIDRRLEAELQARRSQLREEIALRMRREAAAAHYDRINARHPIQDRLAGLTQAEEDERQRIMAARSKATYAKMDAANARLVPGQVAHSLRTKRVDGVGGSSGFKIR